MNHSSHFIGICGKGMGAIAGALARAGWKVTGCDTNPQPPMRDYLQGLGITICTPCEPAHLPPEGTEIVVGKRVPDDHSVLEHLRRAGRSWHSFPGFLAKHFLRHSRNTVVAGGVGKTTTTSMLAWIFEQAGLAPDYLIGGLPRCFAHPARFEGSAHAVIEGDEYASCGNDPRPKFLHYHPGVVIVTNLLEDHPDLYDGMDALQRAFEELVGLLPRDGLLVLPDDDRVAAGLAGVAACPVATIGFTAGAGWHIEKRENRPDRSVFRFDGTTVHLPMCGGMNMRNAAMAMAAARHFGVAPALAAEALADFCGVLNRQDSRAIGTVEMVTDKATHPHAVKALIVSLRQRFPGRRLVCFLQPRATGGRNWVYQREFPGALAGVDHLLVSAAYEHQPKAGQTWSGGTFDVAKLAAETRRLGVPVDEANGTAELEPLFARVLRPGDVVMVLVPEQARALTEDIAVLLVRQFAGGQDSP